MLALLRCGTSAKWVWAVGDTAWAWAHMWAYAVGHVGALSWACLRQGRACMVVGARGDGHM